MPTDTEMITTSDSRRASVLRCLCLLLAAAVVFQLFYLGSQQFAPGLVPAPWDKLAHLTVYSAITALLWIGTGGIMPVLVIVAVIAIGALDELHQAGVPGRHAAIDDLLVDICAGVGTGIAMFLHARVRRRHL